MAFLYPNNLWDAHTNDDGKQYRIGGSVDVLNALDYGAKGDASTDDTVALSAWIAAANASTKGALCFLPPGQYDITKPLPAVTAKTVGFLGVGWSQTNFTVGSVITAASGYADTGSMFGLAGEGGEIRGIVLDGANRSTSICAVTGANCRLLAMSTHGTKANGVAIDGQTGSISLWIDNCRINGINYPNTAIQLNDTDAIITHSKPVNTTYGIELLGGASGTIIADNHITPGATNGLNAIFINGNPSHVQIDGNRFDNHTNAAIQITPPSSTPNSIAITANHFHSTVVTDNTWAAIAVDTTASAVRALHIVGNSVYGSASHQHAWFLAAQKSDGSTPTNTTRLASLGTVCNSNVAWANTAFFGHVPTIARGNMTATDGQTYAAVTDI